MIRWIYFYNIFDDDFFILESVTHFFFLSVVALNILSRCLYLDHRFQNIADQPNRLFLRATIWYQLRTIYLFFSHIMCDRLHTAEWNTLFKPCFTFNKLHEQKQMTNIVTKKIVFIFVTISSNVWLIFLN